MPKAKQAKLSVDFISGEVIDLLEILGEATQWESYFKRDALFTLQEAFAQRDLLKAMQMDISAEFKLNMHIWDISK